MISSSPHGIVQKSSLLKNVTALRPPRLIEGKYPPPTEENRKNERSRIKDNWWSCGGACLMEMPKTYDWCVWDLSDIIHYTESFHRKIPYIYYLISKMASEIYVAPMTFWHSEFLTFWLLILLIYFFLWTWLSLHLTFSGLDFLWTWLSLDMTFSGLSLNLTLINID